MGSAWEDGPGEDWDRKPPWIIQVPLGSGGGLGLHLGGWGDLGKLGTGATVWIELGAAGRDPRGGSGAALGHPCRPGLIQDSHPPHPQPCLPHIGLVPSDANSSMDHSC